MSVVCHDVMKTITKRPKLALYIIAVCLCGLISIFGPGYVTTQRAKRGLLTRTVSKTENSAITEIWRLDDVVITLNAPSTPLIATKDQLFIYGDIGSLNGRLLKLDPANGTIISDETPGTFALPLSFTTVSTLPSSLAEGSTASSSGITASCSGFPTI